MKPWPFLKLQIFVHNLQTSCLQNYQKKKKLVKQESPFIRLPPLSSLWAACLLEHSLEASQWGTQGSGSRCCLPKERLGTRRMKKLFKIQYA